MTTEIFTDYLAKTAPEQRERTQEVLNWLRGSLGISQCSPTMTRLLSASVILKSI
jgi:uncharacterized protein YdhG (YjbR/CyaY superfamily)